MAKYKFSLYTKNNILFKEMESSHAFCINVANKLYYYQNCILKITNLETGKEYDAISMQEICNLLNKNVDVDTILLTTYNIAEETAESTHIPINILYPIVSKLKAFFINKTKKEVLFTLKKKTEQSPALNKEIRLMSLESNKDFNKLNKNNQIQLSLFGYDGVQDINQFLDELENNNTNLLLYAKSFYNNIK